MKKVVLTISSLLLLAGLSFAQIQKTTYWPKGQKMSEGFYNHESTLAANASKEERKNEVNKPLKVGKWQNWYENGQLQSEQTFTNEGRPTGVLKTWYPSGKTESVVDYSGQKSEYWFENGTKQSEGPILTDGTPVGNWTGWHSNGVKNYEGLYDQGGNKVGVWKFWDEKSRSIAQQTYKNGTVVN